MPEVCGIEISQDQFDKASAIFDKIEILKQEQRKCPDLQGKLNIRYEISRLIEERYKILGL